MKLKILLMRHGQSDFTEIIQAFQKYQFDLFYYFKGQKIDYFMDSNLNLRGQVDIKQKINLIKKHPIKIVFISPMV